MGTEDTDRTTPTAGERLPDAFGDDPREQWRAMAPDRGVPSRRDRPRVNPRGWAWVLIGLGAGVVLAGPTWMAWWEERTPNSAMLRHHWLGSGLVLVSLGGVPAFLSTKGGRVLQALGLGLLLVGTTLLGMHVARGWFS